MSDKPKLTLTEDEICSLDGEDAVNFMGGNRV